MPTQDWLIVRQFTRKYNIYYWWISEWKSSYHNHYDIENIFNQNIANVSFSDDWIYVTTETNFRYRITSTKESIERVTRCLNTSSK